MQKVRLDSAKPGKTPAIRFDRDVSETLYLKKARFPYAQVIGLHLVVTAKATDGKGGKSMLGWKRNFIIYQNVGTWSL